VNNYRQALDILSGASALEKSMANLEITDVKVFTEWLEEERDYLKGLLKELLQETQEIEYYLKLVNFHASE
jgi:uncharacterized membrane protein YvbJ